MNYVFEANKWQYVWAVQLFARHLAVVIGTVHKIPSQLSTGCLTNYVFEL